MQRPIHEMMHDIITASMEQSKVGTTVPPSVDASALVIMVIVFVLLWYTFFAKRTQE